MTNYYLHILDGQPAEFVPDQKTICFVTRYGSAGVLATSLRQIRREQAIDQKENPETSGDFEYSYCRVRVEKEQCQ